MRLTVGRGVIRAVGVSRGSDADEYIPWRVEYDLSWDRRWRFRRATVRSQDVVRRIDRTDSTGWRIDGRPHPEFADCVDLDLQVSLLTNTAPIHRFGPGLGAQPAPAVYLTSALAVERLDQTYRRRPGRRVRFDYDSPRHGYRATLTFEADGFVSDYPFIGRRAGVTSTTWRSE